MPDLSVDPYDVERRLERQRRALENNRTLQLLSKEKGRFLLALFSELYGNAKSIEKSELMAALGDYVEGCRDADWFPESLGILGGTSREISAAIVASAARPWATEGGWGLLHGSTDHEDLRDYYALTDLAVEAQALVRRLDGEANAFNPITARSFSDLVATVRALARGDIDAVIRVKQEQVDRLQKEIDELRGGAVGMSLKEHCSALLVEGEGMPASIMAYGAAWREQERKMVDDLRGGRAGAEIWEEQESWRSALSLSHDHTCYEQAEAALSNELEDGGGVDGAQVGDLDPDTRVLMQRGTEVVEATYRAMAAVWDDRQSWNLQKQRCARAGRDPQAAERLRQLKNMAAGFMDFCASMPRRNFELRGCKPFYSGSRRLFPAKDNLGDGTVAACAEIEDPLPVAPEELAAERLRQRRLGAWDGRRAVECVVASPVRTSDGLVDVAASFSAAGEDAYLQDILSFVEIFSPLKSVARGDAEWAAEDVDGERRVMRGPRILLPEEALLGVLANHGETEREIHD